MLDVKVPQTLNPKPIDVKVHDASEIFQPQRHEEQRLYAPLGSAASNIYPRHL